MIKYTSFVFFMLLSNSVGHATEINSALSTSWNFSNDSDGLTIQKVTLGALPTYISATQSHGIEWQGQRYRQNDSVISGQGINYAWQSVDSMTGMGNTLRAGLNQQGSAKPILAIDWNFNRAHNEFINWGLTVNSDWVESMAALQNGTRYDLVGASLDGQIHPRFTMVGAVNQTYFSDGHDRQQQRLRAIWDAWPDQGLTIQWSYKHQTGQTLTNPTYFNPDRLDESMGLIGWRKRVNGWQWYARLGSGTQTINSLTSSPVQLMELQITSPPKEKSFFKLRMGHNETFGINGPGYTYRYAELQYIFPLER